MVGQPTPGVPVYTVKSLAGGRTKVLHRNLLLPLQGRVRHEGEPVEEGVTDSDEEEEGRAVRPKVARAPKRSPRVTTKPQGSHTPAESSASPLTDHSPPESISGDGDSDEEEETFYNTDSLTSHTTASSSTSADILSAEASHHTPPMPDSVTESQFSTIMPYMEDSGQTSDSVFLETSSSIDPHASQPIPTSSIETDSVASSPVAITDKQTPAPRRSARSTRGAPPVRFGKVITHSTRVTKVTDTPTIQTNIIYLLYAKHYFGLMLYICIFDSINL